MTRMIRGLHPSTLTTTIAVLSLLSGLNTKVQSAPYASGVSIQNTTVSFTLNEAADTLMVSINGGPFSFLDGSTKGLKTFSLGSTSDTFSITALKNDSVGYTIPTGGTLPLASGGLSQDTIEAGFRLLSDDANPLVNFLSPRGVTVATNPNIPQFGTTYISNSAAGTTANALRSVGDGLYGLKADQSDAFGYGDAAQATGFETAPNSASPFRVSFGGDNNVYIADWSDPYGGVYRMGPTLTNPTQILAGIGGPGDASGPILPPGQNHGSVAAVHVSASASGVTVYTIDEDLTSAQLGGAETNDVNSLWKYDIGASALPYDGTPTKLASALLKFLPGGVVADMDRGADGKFYLSQFRTPGREAGITVLSEDGTQVLFDSLTESRNLLGDPQAIDIFRNVQAIAISPDQKYLAVMMNNSNVAIVPLLDGIPLLANRMLVDTGTEVNSGRDIAFDAAGNIHYVSSGQQIYRVLAPGGFTAMTTSWDGTAFSFATVPEPSSALLIGMGGLLLARRRRFPKEPQLLP